MFDKIGRIAMAPPGRPIVAIAADGSSRETYATARKAAEATGVSHTTITQGRQSLTKHGGTSSSSTATPANPSSNELRLSRPKTEHERRLCFTTCRVQMANSSRSSV